MKLGSGPTTFTTLSVSLLNGAGNHGIWLSDLTIIPEPSTYALVLGLGTFGLIVARRRFGHRT